MNQPSAVAGGEEVIELEPQPEMATPDWSNSAGSWRTVEIKDAEQAAVSMAREQIKDAAQAARRERVMDEVRAVRQMFGFITLAAFGYLAAKPDGDVASVVLTAVVVMALVQIGIVGVLYFRQEE